MRVKNYAERKGMNLYLICLKATRATISIEVSIEGILPKMMPLMAEYFQEESMELLLPESII